ncbi:hypothetical protein VNO77_04905 [Canavalia gladiata]|uniref:FHA domain-containing protein n=1 Tax=Canavalia gladiata TaxID=3824 RepID=A0AAN9N3W0_CANGL
MEAEEAPTLRLLMLQGPRQGESVEFPPGSSIRIGRVVRGNSLTIKDSGISSKHLSILTESSKWVLRDLDSSNGTVLDGSKIPPHTPFPLHHDSIIKIGELTSIHITFLQDQPHTTHVRRNPTRRGRTAPIEPAAPVPKPGRSRAKGLKGKVQIQTIDENVAVANESEHAGRPAPVTWNSKKKLSVVAVPDSGVESLDAPAEKVEEPESTRNPSLIEVSDSCVGDSDPPVEEAKNVRVNRNSKNTRSVAKEGSRSSSLERGVENVEKMKTRGATEKRELMEESCEGRENENLNGGDGHWPDLKKMSLGEWFDFLEVHLPKQIIGATEEMIESMTQKAERLRNYIIQQQNVH